MKKLLMLSFILLLSMPGIAGDKGHGGTGKVCFKSSQIVTQIEKDLKLEIERSKKESRDAVLAIPDKYIGQITNIEILDLVLAKKKVGLSEQIQRLENQELNNGWKKDEFFDYIVEQKLSEIGMVKALVTRGINKTKNSRYVYNEPLHQAGDVILNAPENTQNCLVTTIVKQVPVSKEIVELHTDNRLYNHKAHSEFSKAILDIHEYLMAGTARTDENLANDTRKVMGVFLDSNKTYYDIYKVFRSYGFKFKNFNKKDLKINVNFYNDIDSFFYSFLSGFNSFYNEYMDLIDGYVGGRGEVGPYQLFGYLANNANGKSMNRKYSKKERVLWETIRDTLRGPIKALVVNNSSVLSVSRVIENYDEVIKLCKRSAQSHAEYICSKLSQNMDKYIKLYNDKNTEFTLGFQSIMNKYRNEILILDKEEDNERLEDKINYLAEIILDERYDSLMYGESVTRGRVDRKIKEINSFYEDMLKNGYTIWTEGIE